MVDLYLYLNQQILIDYTSISSITTLQKAGWLTVNWIVPNILFID